jgi:hypothetical protein
MENIESDKLFRLGMKGKEYELTGETEKWVEIYENMIQKNWDGSYIYEKLSIFYKKNKKYKEAARVISKFLEIYTIWLDKGNYPIETSNKYIKFKKRLDSIQKYL